MKEVGQILYDVHREYAGNTTMKRTGVWLVKITAVNSDGSIMASWNGNPPKSYWRLPSSWRKTKPYIVKSSVFNGQRLARRGEVKAAKSIREQADMFVVEV
jgi:hypothetical protein